MLAAAMDMSEDPKVGDHRFLGVVLGTRYKIDSIIKYIGREIHMRDIKSGEMQRRILSKVCFDGRENTAFCVRLYKHKIISELVPAKAKGRTVKKQKTHMAYNRLVFQHMREEMEKFLYVHGHSVDDIVFECDSDCIYIC